MTKPGNHIGWYLPAALLIGLVMLYPALRTLLLSFHELNLANALTAEFVGLDNYRRALADSRLHTTLGVTAIFTLASVTVEFSLGLVLALAVDACIRGRDAVRTILLAPWTLPTAVIAVLWAWIFNDQFGILNSLLLRAGLIETPVAWLSQAATAITALVVADVWKTTPFVFIVLLAGLQSIPRELYEALEVDGGGGWAKFRRITWPFLSRFVFIAVIFRVIQAFAIFDLVYVMTGGGPGGSTETVSVYVYQTMMRYLDFGYAAALAVSAVALLAAAAAVLYRFLVRRNEELF